MINAKSISVPSRVEQFGSICVSYSECCSPCANVPHYERRMRYWAYLVAKLVVAAGILWGTRRLMTAVMPAPETFMYMRVGDPFVTDLTYTFCMLLFWLFGAGIVWLIVL